MNACPVQKLPPIVSMRLMTPDQLWDHLEDWGDKLPSEVARLAPLTVEHQKTLLAFSHYMTPYMRETLLMRLASCPCFYAPLLYELADRAGRDGRMKAAAEARKNRCSDAAFMLENIS